MLCVCAAIAFHLPCARGLRGEVSWRIIWGKELQFGPGLMSASQIRSPGWLEQLFSKWLVLGMKGDTLCVGQRPFPICPPQILKTARHKTAKCTFPQGILAVWGACGCQSPGAVSCQTHMLQGIPHLLVSGTSSNMLPNIHFAKENNTFVASGKLSNIVQHVSNTCPTCVQHNVQQHPKSLVFK